jgi:hypothetical protein
MATSSMPLHLLLQMSFSDDCHKPLFEWLVNYLAKDALMELEKLLPSRGGAYFESDNRALCGMV